jgi:hypothetical protein
MRTFLQESKKKIKNKNIKTYKDKTQLIFQEVEISKYDLDIRKIH